ncbi:MAG: hypothetical protein JW939_07515 [Candidatus Thermoplasmatota archaeon]|nr:hypothetical protein [Candidatus Thermoplasmatota archaeon]
MFRDILPIIEQLRSFVPDQLSERSFRRPGAGVIEQIKTAYRYLLVMGAGMILLLFSVMVPVLSSDSDFSIYNTGWNGCSRLGKDTYSTGSFIPTIDLSASSEERVVHSSFSEIGSDIRPSRSSLLIIGPDISFSREEGEFAHEFLSEGGLVLLADDFGTGNELLSYLNTTTRFSGRMMLDLSYMKSSKFSVTTEFFPHEVTRNLTMLLMNMPSTVVPSTKAFPVINSSKTSWLSLDGNERWDEDDPSGPFPILTIEKYGRGILAVLSEPSLLINQMRKEMDNGIFVQNLLGFISDGRDSVMIDESHRDLTNPVQVTNSFVASLDLHQKVGIMIALTIVFLVMSTELPRMLMGSVRKLIDRLLSEKPDGPGDARAPLEMVMERHPDWDRAELERLIRDIEG